MQEGKAIAVTLSVMSSDDNEVVRALEIIGRLAGGLALEGLSCSISALSIDDPVDHDHL